MVRHLLVLGGHTRYLRGVNSPHREHESCAIGDTGKYNIGSTIQCIIIMVDMWLRLAA